jgi:hypothetical protein
MAKQCPIKIGSIGNPRPESTKNQGLFWDKHQLTALHAWQLVGALSAVYYCVSDFYIFGNQ